MANICSPRMAPRTMSPWWTSAPTRKSRASRPARAPGGSPSCRAHPDSLADDEHFLMRDAAREAFLVGTRPHNRRLADFEGLLVELVDRAGHAAVERIADLRSRLALRESDLHGSAVGAAAGCDRRRVEHVAPGQTQDPLLEERHARLIDRLPGERRHLDLTVRVHAHESNRAPDIVG